MNADRDATAATGSPRAGASQAPGRVAWTLLAAVALGLLVFDLGGIDLWAPDEPRYAQVAEEMRRAERGAQDLVLLRLGGEPYTQKPPLYFWLAAGLGGLSGSVSEWSARLPSAMAGLATLALWARIGWRLHPGTSVAWLTTALLLTSFRFAHFARRAQLDVLLALFETAALVGFIAWHDAETPGARRRALSWIHVATALGLLTKGPVALLPWVCFAGVLACERRARDIPKLFPPLGLVVSLGPVLCWIAASVALAPAGFFEEAVVDNLWGRFASGTAHVRPITYYLWQLPIEALPWSLLWPWAAFSIWKSSRARPPAASPLDPHAEAGRAFERRLLAAWIAVPLLFFSISAGKRGLYLLPVLPALTLGLAVWIERASADAARRHVIRGPALPLVLAAVLGAVAAGAGWFRPEAVVPAAAFDTARRGLLVIAAVTGASGLVALRARRSEAGALPTGLVAAWAGIVCVFGLLFFAVMPGLDPEKSPRPIARALAAASSPGETVGVLDQPAMLGGLLFYLPERRELAERHELSELRELSERPKLGTPENGASGEPRVRRLDGAGALERFVEDGGRVVVARTSHTERLAALESVCVAAQLRSGRRGQTVFVIGSANGAGDAGDAGGAEGVPPAAAGAGVHACGAP